jgi:hypothetical protein
MSLSYFPTAYKVAEKLSRDDSGAAYAQGIILAPPCGLTRYLLPFVITFL